MRAWRRRCDLLASQAALVNRSVDELASSVQRQLFSDLNSRTILLALENYLASETTKLQPARVQRSKTPIHAVHRDNNRNVHLQDGVHPQLSALQNTG